MLEIAQSPHCQIQRLVAEYRAHCQIQRLVAEYRAHCQIQRLVAEYRALTGSAIFCHYFTVVIVQYQKETSFHFHWCTNLFCSIFDLLID